MRQDARTLSGQNLAWPAASVTVQFLRRQGEGYPHTKFRRVAPSREDDALRRRGCAGAGLIAIKIHNKHGILALHQLAVISAGHGQKPGEISPVPARGRAAFHIHQHRDLHFHTATPDKVTGSRNPRNPPIHQQGRQIRRRAGAIAADIRPIRQDRNHRAGRQDRFLG